MSIEAGVQSVKPEPGAVARAAVTLAHALSMAGALVGLLALISGCTAVVDANRTQCSKDSDCTARGAEFAGSSCVDSFCQASSKWACLDNPVQRTPSGSEFEVSFVVKDFVKLSPLGNVSARLCYKLDLTCKEPIGLPQTSDDAGKMTFRVPAAFDGYVRFESATTVPGLYFFNPPVTEDLPGLLVSLSSPQVVQLLVQQIAGSAWKDDHGIALISALDCAGVPSAGVELKPKSIDPDAVRFYSKQNFPTNEATVTDATGYGGFVNVTTGTVTFTGSLAASGRSIGEVTVPVQAGAQTIVNLVPNGG